MPGREARRFSELAIEPNQPLDVEIGCGVGVYSLKYALSNPNRKLVAIEKTETRFRKFSQTLAAHRPIQNLFPIHANAIHWIVHFLPVNRVDRYFILYPNPEPKRRNQRWHAMPFMGTLLASLKGNGSITIATNIAQYYLEAKEYMRDTWGLSLDEDRIVGPDENPRTAFERKYLERGELCYNLEFRKGAT